MERALPTKNLTIGQRGAIVHLSIAGKSVAEIAEQMGCSRKTVQRWIERHDETGDIKRKQGSGRPRKVTQQLSRHIVDHIRRDPITTSRNIISKICCLFFSLFKINLSFPQRLADLNLNISRYTLSRTLKKHGLHARVASKKFFLTPQHARERFQFAADYGEYDQEWWSNVIFCDEKSFRYD